MPTPPSSPDRVRVFARTLVALALLGAAPLGAQQQVADTTRPPTLLPGVVTTATRTPKLLSEIAAPVIAVDSTKLRTAMPNTAADLLRELPGVDVTGVGTNQARPVIRGQRGQRILLLQDGIRLNNSRRQQDFGELPALVDVNDIARVEIVRGPSSVLYGTDAIGGVINLITREPASEGMHGQFGYLHGGSDDAQRRGFGSLSQRVGRFSYRVSGSYRETSDYSAPAGSFGDLRLAERERVFDSGVRDDSYGATLAFDVAARQSVFVKAERYQARDAGFGFIRPEAFGDGEPRIQITYPDQDVRKYFAGFRSSSRVGPLADRVEVTGYLTDNARDLHMDVLVPIGPTATVRSFSANFTDMRTIGARAEATKILGGRHLLTYGIDAFRDRSRNSDSSETTVTGFGPPSTQRSTVPTVPNASFRSAGAFAQLDLRPVDRLSLVLGARHQGVGAESEETAGITAPTVSSSDRTTVGTANVLYRVNGSLNLIAGVGRGFRAPNLIERFFDGAAPEGGYQRANPTLSAETSVNVDVGARWHRGLLLAEAFVFRNEVADGIRARATGDSVNRQPVYQNVNLEKLRYTGGEATIGINPLGALSALASYSRLESRDVVNDDPVGESYSTKLTGELTYRDQPRGHSISYLVRHQGERKDGQIADGPVGPTLPAFTVHGLRASVRVLERGGIRNDLLLTVDNLTDVLYAESANVSFFRPQPGRSITLGWTVGF